MPRARTASRDADQERKRSPRRSSSNVARSRSASVQSGSSGRVRAAPFTMIGPGTAAEGEVPSDSQSPDALSFSADDARHDATIGSVPKVKMAPCR